ncbi:MAG: hypothetical protein A3H69_00035 [Candidatus Sungbacteria bacterium RIFCSPLOWO2_02_FULL_47_9]|uniref:DUF4446 domain-containing protein n=1 Tax=Candidatus Sungbacteria bacterium RIFCSPHIGHO2_01_FULL_47_32 TaxID=1802264 RepID=A0A1G2K5Q2_9BACT|nr:MAG: hypothetical protein UX72_C0036G0005 [Parcubacteria group bacterium GW2011_GWA2_47_10]OGZ94503.1 MAG: hypothetical protein A2633_05405 [Candidatus Sungbacteria bacterium RIFCSPHIGHO2_01_FULL_47_32]OGZ98937.1 MAG: hypothetical protein A3D57_04375 [Candidatus Sungbacteria bacterium RIFCSPHIGHO2_02_FULL_46_12]OHA05095.1 MAG: hypothetical protein A3A28_01860 [Candidatus Sungbacteria bacterium RIFCSPLOWO2_01_FULL_47_32]OHA09524.1 MAG: hypothetical protein A3H69_00035 [Candidatus Sungbacteria
MAFTSQNLTIAAIAVLALFSGVLLVLTLGMKKKWNAVFGVNAKDQSDAFKETLARLGKAEIRLDVLEPRIAVLEAISNIAVQKVGFKRYNPFAETGGDQSFTLVLLDRTNNGIIFSSLYSRDNARAYGKKIENGIPKHPLSEEEKSALEETLKQK